MKTCASLGLAVLMLSFRALAVDGPEGDRLELPGVSADRATKTVRLSARACGVEPRAPTEFFIIATNSGHDYESVAVAGAKPSEVHRALEFLGMKPGRPANIDQLQLWPRGERVTVTVEWTPTNGSPRTARIEDFILDARTGKTLPRDGFMFTGSEWITADDGSGRRDYAADVLEPHAIVTAYNLGSTVLDVPRRGSQGELYDFQVTNPDLVLPKGQPLTLVLAPEVRPDGQPRVLDLSLRIAPAAAAGGLRLQLRDADGKTLADGAAAEAAAAIRGLSEAGRDPFLDVVFDVSAPVGILRAAAIAVDDMVLKHDARVNPPPAGRLYYRAFIPAPSLKDRASRPAQPWELRLRRADGRIAGVLTKIDRVRDLITDEPTFATKEFPVASSDALVTALKENGPGLPVILVLAPPAIVCGELEAFVGPAMKTHPIVHVFADGGVGIP